MGEDEAKTGEGNKEQNIPPRELIPRRETSKIASGLADELVDVLAAIPDFREKAALAFAYGPDDIVFLCNGRDYQVSRRFGAFLLQIGEPGAFTSASAPLRDTEISIDFGLLRGTPDIRYLDKNVYWPSPNGPDIHLPQRNTRAAEAGIRQVIESLKSSQPATPLVSPTG